MTMNIDEIFPDGIPRLKKTHCAICGICAAVATQGFHDGVHKVCSPCVTRAIDQAVRHRNAASRWDDSSFRDAINEIAWGDMGGREPFDDDETIAKLHEYSLKAYGFEQYIEHEVCCLEHQKEIECIDRIIKSNVVETTTLGEN